VITKRSLLWIGLALVAASPLLGAGTLLSWLIGHEAPETPAVLIVERLAQILAFAGGIAVLRSRSPGAKPFPLRALCELAAAVVGMQGATLLFAASTGVAEMLWACAAA